jgi:hypothetical protein
MKLHRHCSVLVALVGALVYAADNPLKSGPQVGAKISQSFDVRICNGQDAGDMVCLV